MQRIFSKIFNIDQQDIYGYWWIFMDGAFEVEPRASKTSKILGPEYPARYYQKFKISGVENSTSAHCGRVVGGGGAITGGGGYPEK